RKAPGHFAFYRHKRKIRCFSVVLGMADTKQGMKAISALNCKNIVSAHSFFLSPHYFDEINLEFLLQNSQKLSSAFEILEDELSKKNVYFLY
ncbi:MAG: hypothetical protein ABF535_09820, partial [Acetobacter sp.]